MPLRVLLTNENRGFGGAEVHTLEVARGLAARGHYVHLAAKKGSWLAGQEANRKSTGASLTVHLVPMSSEVDPVSVAVFRALMRRHRIEAVHAQATRDLVLAALARKTLKAPPRLIKSEHTFLGSHRSQLCDWAYRGADRLVCVSEALRGQMIAALGGPPEHYTVVPNGIDLDRICPGYSAHPKLREGRWVGAVGSLIPGKGQEDFLQAATRLRTDIRLVVAGDGPEKERLERLAEELGLKVWFPGFVEDPISVLAGLEVVVVPSHQETFSLVSLEAMALGKPLVATRTGGIPEVVEDGVTGTLVPTGDPEALAGAIATYLDDPGRASGHGQGARERATARYTLDSMLTSFERLYES